MTKPRIDTAGAVLLVLAAAAIAFGAPGSGNPRAGKDASPREVVSEVATIAQRVERIRGVHFRTVPKPEVVTPAQTRRRSLAELDRSYPGARRHVDEELLELLGLVPPGTDLRAIEGDVSGGEVAGYYDTTRKRLAVVSGPASSNRVLSEITLSHELNHALEDQRFGIHDSPSSGADDGASAYTALVEGTATAVMSDYTRRYIPPGAAFTSALAALGPSEAAAKSVPPYIQRSLEFSYTGGQDFVNALRDRGGGWRLVNRALAKRPPVSTEQVLHPDKYLHFERPLHVSIGRLGLGRAWRRTARGVMGEADTSELLRLGSPSLAAGAATGWGGARYELWSDARARGSCAAPCRRADVLAVRWRWDTPRDAREFDAALPLYLLHGLHARAAGPALWRVGTSGYPAVRVGPGASTTLVMAGSAGVARRVARSASR